MKDSKFEIRKITRNDIIGYLKAKEASWLDTYPSPENGVTLQMIINRQTKKTLEQKIAGMNKQFDDGEREYSYVLVIDGEIAGCLGLQLLGGDKGQIREIYLDPKYINKGYGRELMLFAKEKFEEKGVTDIAIEAVIYNERAIKFYESFGFKVVGLAEAELKLTEDVIIKEVRLEGKFKIR